MTLAPERERERLLTTPQLPVKLQKHIWQQLGWIPHKLQYAALTSRARQGVLSAGRRVGKSQTGGYKLIPEAFRAMAELPELRAKKLRREYWIVGPEYSDAEKEFRVVWDGLSSLGFTFDKPGSYNNPLSGEMRISMFDGRFIVWAKSAKYPGTLVGEALSGVVFSEAAKLKPSVFDKFIRPTLADFGGWAFFGSTPEGRNWFYDFWSYGQDAARLDWDSWRAPSWDNPYVYPGGCDEDLLKAIMVARKDHKLDEFMKGVKQIQTSMGMVPVGIDPEIYVMLRDMSSEMFTQEVMAEFTEYVGRVFKDFDEEIHVLKREQLLRKDWITYACIDYGFTNPFVWLLLQIDPHGERIHVVDEYYERQRTTGEAGNEIRERGLAPNSGDYRVRAFYPDPSEPDRTRELSALLHIPSRGGTGGPLEDRLEWIRRKLKYPAHLPPGHPERQPWLTVNRRCVNFIREHGLYKYPKTAEQAAIKGQSAPEAPQKKDDHCPEALGRFMIGHFGNPWDKRGGARLSTARVGRR